MENITTKTLIRALVAVADLKDWSGKWLHFTDVNKLGVNPKQFHQDPAGIYFFPEEFKTEGDLWKKKKFVFTAELKPQAKILDLGTLSEKDQIKLAEDLGVTVTEEDFRGKYFDNRSWWERLKNKYILQNKAPGAAKWAKDFRTLGYDGIFDDAKTIFVAEVQLIVFNPKIIKVIGVKENSGKKGAFKKIQDHQKLLAKYLEPWGDVEIKTPRKNKGRYGDPNYIAGEVNVTKGDAYINWSVEEDGVAMMRLTVKDANRRPQGWSLGSLVKNYNEDDIKRAAESAIKFVSSEAEAHLVKALYRCLALSTSDLTRIAKEIADKFFPEIQIPKFKLVKHTHPKWLGSTQAKWVGEAEPEITVSIQKSIIDDEKTLHRVMAHEMIHVWQYQTIDLKKEKQLPKYAQTDFHGKTFTDMAAKMNAVYGKDYVTKTSDLTYVESGQAEYLIIVQPHDDKRYGVSKVVRPSKVQKEEIKKRIDTREAHVFKTKDAMFNSAAPLKKYGGYSVFNKQEVHDKLAEIYKGANLDRKFV